MKPLFLRFVLLAMLLCTLALLTTAPTARTSNLAGACCCQCLPFYNACVAECPPQGQSGHFACIAECRDETSWCTGTCDPTCNDCP